MPKAAIAKRAQINAAPTEVVDLDPNEITVKPENRGRYFDPDVSDLVDSIVAHGRVLQPIGISKDKVLFFGNRRLKAVQEINARKLTKKPMTIPAQILPNVSEEQAFLENLAENYHRQNTTAIDDAHNIKRLQDFGKTNEEICAVYANRKTGNPMSPSWLLERLSLLDLDEDEQRKMHEGKLEADAGMFLADYPAEVRPALLAEGQKEAMKEIRRDAGLDAPTPIDAKGKAATPRKLTKAQRRKQARAKETLKKGPPKVQTKHLKQAARVIGAKKKGQKSAAIKRGLKDVKELFEKYTGPGAPLAVKRFSELFLRWADGEATDAEMDKEFERRFKGAA